jgi:outer membrane lipoprotein-sorting protein
MKRIFLFACCLASLASPVAVAATASAGKLTAEQIVEKNVAARGGLKAWRAVNAITMTGQLDAGGTKNSQLPFVMTMKRPYKSRFEVRFDEQTAVQVYDGTQGWKFRPFLGRNEVEPYTPAEVNSAAAASELDGPLIDYASKGTKVELVGTEAVEKKSAYKLKLTMKGGDQRNLWVDTKSFLEVKIDGEPRKLDGKMHKVAIYYRDYKTVKGLTMPYTLETAVEGVKETHKMTIQTVAVNPPVEDGLFAKPDMTAAKTSQQLVK